MHAIHTWTFPLAFRMIDDLMEDAPRVHNMSWQGVDISSKPEMQTHELENVTLGVPLGGNEMLEHWRHQVGPNLPWADDHFDERVCGQPINPGEEWARWPFGHSAEKFLEQGKFNHNYMERYWPKEAGIVGRPTATAKEYEQRLKELYEQGQDTQRWGIYQPYGDLHDIVSLLCRDPFTRQAYLPIYFPEDTGTPGRKPCSLGYQFMVREGKMHVYYPLRSCDYYRHFRDDIYLTLRLLLWVIDRCREEQEFFEQVVPGNFVMHMTSLHMFANDHHFRFGAK